MAVTVGSGQAQAAIFVERVTIQNFKGIERLEVDLQPGLSLLVGRNNAGKSRILRALHVALGGVAVERDDLTVGSTDPAQIDVFIAPRPGTHPRDADEPSNNEDDQEVLAETFDATLQRLFGLSLQLVSESPDRQRLGWRTTITSTSEGSGARAQSEVLAYDAAADEWQPTGLPVVREVRNLLYAELVDTRRDLDTELRQRGTAIRRILNDLRVPETDREDLEQRLAALGEDILRHSDTLQNVRDSLDSLDQYVDALGAARVDPVPRTLEELARSVGVSFDSGVEPLASRLHGSGVPQSRVAPSAGRLLQPDSGRRRRRNPPAPCDTDRRARGPSAPTRGIRSRRAAEGGWTSGDRDDAFALAGGISDARITSAGEICVRRRAPHHLVRPR